MMSPEKKPRILATEQKIEVLCIYEPMSGTTEGKTQSPWWQFSTHADEMYMTSMGSLHSQPRWDCFKSEHAEGGVEEEGYWEK